MVKNRAFKKYLLSIDRNEACLHLYECLRSGGEASYETVCEALGPKWTFEDRQDMIHKINQVYEFIQTEVSNEF